ncbi:MAG: deaminase [Pseudomonadota bacterium]
MPGTALCVTLEPCTIRVGAITQACVSRPVYGATEPKSGTIVSMLQLFDSTPFNRQPKIEGGALAMQCAEILSRFFEAKQAARAG